MGELAFDAGTVDDGDSFTFESSQQWVELLAEAYERRGPEIFRTATGAFVVLILDAGRRRLHLVRDKCGQLPLYYAQVPEGLIFGSGVGELLDHAQMSRTPDLEAFAEYLSFGFSWSEATLAVGVRSVPPASTLEYDASRGRLEVTRYWSYPRGDEVPDESEAMEAVDAALHRALGRAAARLPAPMISLSAGLDSRTLLAVAASEKLHLDCVTHGIPGSIDFELVPRMCRAVGSNLRRCTYDQDIVGDILRWVTGVVACGDGEAALMDIMMLYIAGKYREHPEIRCVMRGHGGELTKLKRAYQFAIEPELARSKDHDAARERMFKNLTRWTQQRDIASLAAPPWDKILSRLPREAFDARYRSVQDGRCVGQCVSLMFIDPLLSRTMAASMRCLRTRVGTSLPFLDPEVVAAVLRSPISMRFGNDMQVSLVSRNCPRLLTIPNSAMRVPLTASPLRLRIVDFAYRAASRIGYGRCDVPEKWIGRRLGQLFQEVLLDPRSKSRDHVLGQALEALVRRHAGGESKLTTLLSRLTTLELWLRLFVDRQTQEQAASAC